MPDDDPTGSPLVHLMEARIDALEATLQDAQSGASGPIYDIVFPWTWETPNIETTGAVIGQAQAGDIFLYGIAVCSVLPDVAGGFGVHAGSSSGGDLLNGGTVSLGTIPASDIFAAPWTADGQRGIVEDDTDIVIVFDGGGNAQGAGTFYAVLYRPSA